MTLRWGLTSDQGGEDLRAEEALPSRSEHPKMGLRSREWPAVAESEEAVVREMARCLRELREGRAPR